MPGRGFGGANTGGFGQQTQNSQWGQGGMGPMTQGSNYSQGGGQFGATGYQPLPESSGGQGQQRRNPSQGNFGQGRDQFGQSSAGQSSTGQYGRSQGASHHDDHEPHYRTWRENQIASHDRDYARWREEQVRKYDEDYKGWRNERHSTFSKEFEGWRSGRGGQAGGSAPDEPLQGRSANAGTFATDAASEKSAYGQSGATGSVGGAAAGGATPGGATSNPGYVSQGDDDRQKVDPDAAHGANPTLATIADGDV